MRLERASGGLGLFAGLEHMPRRSIAAAGARQEAPSLAALIRGGLRSLAACRQSFLSSREGILIAGRSPNQPETPQPKGYEKKMDMAATTAMERTRYRSVPKDTRDWAASTASFVEGPPPAFMTGFSTFAPP